MLYAVNIFSFIPLLVPIWRATVTLEQHTRGILKRQWYYIHKPGLVIFADDLVRACEVGSDTQSWKIAPCSGLRALVMKMNIETSLDYDSSAKIQ